MWSHSQKLQMWSLKKANVWDTVKREEEEGPSLSWRELALVGVWYQQ